MKSNIEKIFILIIVIFIITFVVCKKKSIKEKFWNLNLFKNRSNMNSYFDQIVCICLPERKNHMRDTFNQWGLYNVTFFDAFQKKKYSHQYFIDKKFLVPNYDEYLNLGRVCCHYSATRVYKKFLESSANNILIFEDDLKRDTFKSPRDFHTKMMPIIKTIPKDWDYLNFSKCYDTCKQNKEIDNPYWNIPVRPLCRTAIALNKKAAKIILSETIPMTSVPGDRMIALLIKNTKKFKAYATKEVTFFQHREKFGTNLNNNVKTNPPKCA